MRLGLGIVRLVVRTLSTSTRKPLMTAKMDSEAFRALFTPELVFVRDLFRKNHFEIRIAGGAVRDLLMGLRPADVDFATTATPSEMQELFTREGIRMFHLRGEEHGTVTCRIADKENFEITTLRVDLVCDGRRAEVEFTRDWALDAERRDLTINSLFLGLDGTVYDYFDGIKDVENRRVAFVNDPVKRIQEDYLRIFRYFRFFGRIAHDDAKHEAETLSAIQTNVGGITNVSGERIWAEVKKIAVGRMAGPVLRTMITEVGLGPQMGLPAEPDMGELSRVWALAEGQRELWKPITVLAALFHTQDEVLAFEKRLRISRAERLLAQFIVEERGRDPGPDPTKHFQDLFLDIEVKSVQEDMRRARSFALKRQLKEALYHFSERGQKRPENREMVVQLLRYLGRDPALIRHLETWEPPSFPVNGFQVYKQGLYMTLANRNKYSS